MTAGRALRRSAHAAVALALAASVSQAQVRAAAAGVRARGALQVCGASMSGCLLETTDRPAIRPERIAGEVVAGTYAGVAGYFIGRGIGTIATMGMSDDNEQLRDDIVQGVGIVGGTFAIGGAVYAIGNLGDETGSFSKTMGGVAVGAATSLFVSHVVFQGRVPADKWSARRKWWMAALESSLPAIGGTIAFNRSRRWER